MVHRTMNPLPFALAVALGFYAGWLLACADATTPDTRQLRPVTVSHDIVDARRLDAKGRSWLIRYRDGRTLRFVFTLPEVQP